MIFRFHNVQNPAELTGPKGYVPIPQSPIFDIGKVQPAGLWQCFYVRTIRCFNFDYDIAVGIKE